MVTLVARQSVTLKCNMQASVMLGNYEFYYAAGLFCRVNGVEVEEEIKPGELKQKIMPMLESFAGSDEKERYLARLLLDYQPTEEYNGQMRELLQWGLRENKMWQGH